MNENIDLTKILKNCPYRTKLYSIVHGEVEFMNIKENNIIVRTVSNDLYSFTSSGKLAWNYEDYSECILLPSKDQRDWSKFTALWYIRDKKKKKTLQPFDKVLVRDGDDEYWRCGLFSCMLGNIVLCEIRWNQGIPYNDETKDLVGTCNEAPDYYKWW